MIEIVCTKKLAEEKGLKPFCRCPRCKVEKGIPNINPQDFEGLPPVEEGEEKDDAPERNQDR